MNHGSPLSKDHRIAKKTEILDKFPKEKYKISMGTTKKLLKKSNQIISQSGMVWLNKYMENRIQGECLPRSFLSNDLPTELIEVYGEQGAEQFIDKVIRDFCVQCGKTMVSPEPTSEQSSKKSNTEESVCKRKPNVPSSLNPSHHPSSSQYESLTDIEEHDMM